MHPVIQEKLPQVVKLCRRNHVARLDLFGSAVRDEFDPVRSDLDFVVEYLPVPEAKTMEAYFGFKEALEQLFGRKVDLVERTAVQNRFFREELEETQVSIFAA